MSLFVEWVFKCEGLLGRPRIVLNHLHTGGITVSVRESHASRPNTPSPPTSSGIGVDDMPPTNKLINTTVGYRIRPGGHGVTLSDWQAYMDFADHHLGE